MNDGFADIDVQRAALDGAGGAVVVVSAAAVVVVSPAGRLSWSSRWQPS